MEVKEYAVRLIADVKDFTSNLKKTQQEMTLTQKTASEFSRAMERSLTSSNPAARKLGQEMQSISQQYKANNDELKRLGQSAEEYGEKLEELKAKHAQQQAELERTRQELSSLEEAAKKAAGIQAEMQAQPAIRASVWDRVNQEAQRAAEAVEECKGRLEAQKNALDGTERSMSLYANASNSVQQETSMIRDRLIETTTEMQRLAGQSGNLTKVGTFMTMLGTKTAQLATKLAQLGKAAGQKVVSGFSSLISRAREARQQTNVINSAVSKLTGTLNSFGHLLIRRFKRQVISQIYNGIAEGFKSAAQESARFNTAISVLGSQLKTLSNAIVGIVEPIAVAFAPALTYVANVATMAADKVAQFVAVLTGSDTYLKARKVQFDYASSLNDTSKNATKAAKATNKASDAAKKYSRTVMSFDELHNLDDHSKNDSDSNTDTTSGAIETPELKFDKQKANAFSDFAKKLRNAFKAGDWKKLGSLMADGINKAFSWADNAIKWKNSGAKITEACNAISQTLNSFVSSLNWGLIGRTFGDGINTLINTVRLLQTGINWTAIGQGFGTGVRSLFETVNWHELGQAIIEGIQIPVRMLQGFLETPGLFENAGKAFRDSIAGIVDGLDSTLIGQTIADFVNGISVLITEAFSDFSKFAELGEKVASNVNTAFSNFNAESFAKGVSNLVSCLFQTVVSFIENTDWYLIGTKITEFVADIDWGHLVNLLSEGLGAAFGAFAVFLQGIADTLVNKIKKYFTDKVTEWQSLGGGVIGGILYGITSALYDIGNWINQNIFLPIFRGIMKAFGIEIGTGSKKTEGQGENIVLGMLKGITNGLRDIGGWIKTNLFDKVWGAIETAFKISGAVVGVFLDLGKDLITNIKDGLTDKIEDVLDFFRGLPDKFINAVKETWGNLKDLGTSIISNIWEGITSFHLTLPHFTLSGSWNLDPFNFQMPSIGIAWYSKGGFPEDGLFMANHGELVGQFANGRTAVANNEQIIDGIKYGVADAIAPFIFEVINAINNQENGQTIEMDGEKVAEIVTRRQQENARRYVRR